MSYTTELSPNAERPALLYRVIYGVPTEGNQSGLPNDQLVARGAWKTRPLEVYADLHLRVQVKDRVGNESKSPFMTFTSQWRDALMIRENFLKQGKEHVRIVVVDGRKVRDIFSAFEISMNLGYAANGSRFLGNRFCHENEFLIRGVVDVR
ncbi:hypothetical protein EJ05DRAFT_30602 [Pseudovirgaria hyperparasitica]|uniref:Uncharacterized protein n=1 Tax=Pseudovirgaria hyperparasitica TaxID=470096 RepID=A0A6A6WM57_9PEZI|nr:uncharacterized protein EJ05DRAFT_30602 [Pseudovirgaria hyperparasitica]KAF2763242.1 hypothetical protein EJ05DRAFT_30602 [Pseudovirgaria hyperparasitica]